MSLIGQKYTTYNNIKKYITTYNTIKFCILLYTLPIVYKRLKQFNELRRVIQSTSTNDGMLSSIYKTIRVLHISLLNVVNQRLYGSTAIGRSISYVPYFHGSKWYYFPIVSKRGPKPIIDRVIGDGKDITDFITKLAGPNVDFYNHKIYPRHIDYKQLTITINGKDKVFEEEDYIVI